MGSDRTPSWRAIRLMPINSDKPHLWKRDIERSVDQFNVWFMTFAPKAFRESRVATTAQVEKAIILTNDLTDIGPEALLAEVARGLAEVARGLAEVARGHAGGGVWVGDQAQVGAAGEQGVGGEDPDRVAERARLAKFHRTGEPGVRWLRRVVGGEGDVRRVDQTRRRRRCGRTPPRRARRRRTGGRARS